MIRIKRLNESNENDFQEEDFERWLEGESNMKIVDSMFQIFKTFTIDSNVDETFFIGVLMNIFYDPFKKRLSVDHELELKLVDKMNSADWLDATQVKIEFDFYNSIVKNYDLISDYLTEIEDNGFKCSFESHQDEFSLYDMLIIGKNSLLSDDLDKLGDTIKIINSLIKRLSSILNI